MTIWCMRIACWVPKTTNTHSGCVILTAFPLQQWLHECASLLHYTFIACLFLNFPVVKVFGLHSESIGICSHVYQFLVL